MSSPAPRPFVIIGENIHTSRIVKRDGPRGGTMPDGRPAVRFPDGAGGERCFPVPSILTETRDFASGRIKHLMAAVLVGMSEDHEADAAAAYVRWVAARQVAGGARYLDLNVDEIDVTVEGRCRAIGWLVHTVGPVAGVPLSIDSSDSAVLEAGLAEIDPAWAAGAPPLINSASVERPEVLRMARERGSPVVLSCTGTVMPTGADERIERAVEIVDQALAQGLPLEDLHVDPLVVPIAVDPESTTAFLEAVRAVRARYGPAVHITCGVSNVSFGLPARRLISETFLDLAAQAGLDSGIIDPVTTDVARALAPDRSGEGYRMAADMLTGVDLYGMDFIEAFRAGRFTEA